MNYIDIAFRDIDQRITHTRPFENPKKAIKQLEMAVRKQMSAEAIVSPNYSYKRTQAGLWLSSTWTEIALKIVGLTLIGAVAGGLIAAGFAPSAEHLSAHELQHQWTNILYASLYGAAIGGGLAFLIYLTAKVASHYNPHIKHRLSLEIELEKRSDRSTWSYQDALHCIEKELGKPPQGDILGSEITDSAAASHWSQPNSSEDLNKYTKEITSQVNELRKEIEQRITASPGLYLSHSWTRVAAIIVGLALIGGIIGGAIAFSGVPTELSTSAKLLLAAKQSFLWIVGGAATGVLGCLIAKIASCYSKTAKSKFIKNAIEKRIDQIFEQRPNTREYLRYCWHLKHELDFQEGIKKLSLNQFGTQTYLLGASLFHNFGSHFWNQTSPDGVVLATISCRINKLDATPLPSANIANSYL